MMDGITVETDPLRGPGGEAALHQPCCFGEDFAAWLKQKLSRLPEPGMELSQPIQEDYGWGLWASCGKDRFWIALSYVGDGPQEPPAHLEWRLYV